MLNPLRSTSAWTNPVKRPCGGQEKLFPAIRSRFSQSVRQANDARTFVANVRLDSPGGNLLKGVKNCRRYKVWQDIHHSSISSAVASRHGVLLLRDVQTTGNKPRRHQPNRNQNNSAIRIEQPQEFPVSRRNSNCVAQSDLGQVGIFF